jgi:PhnB protein
MAQLNPYLNFDNNCREAMNFYKYCLGGELKLQTVAKCRQWLHKCPRK